MIAGRIVPRLLLGFLVLSPLPLAGLAWLYTQAFEQAVTETVLANVSSLADKKTDQINSYLDERVLDSQMLAKSPAVYRALQTLPRLLQPGEAAVSLRYRTREADYRDYLRSLFDLGHYHDVLLIDTAGNVVFSIRREPDFASNLNAGPYRDSTLARAHREALALLSTRTTSAQPYAASGDRPTIFIVTPVIRSGKPLGTVALQLDLDQLTAVTTDNTGLGDSGETGLAQAEGTEALYVVPLHRIPDAAFRYRVAKDQAAKPMRDALAGDRGRGISRDYAGVEVIAAWRYLPALRWGMVVKIDTAEALAPVQRLREFSLAAFGFLLLAASLVAAMFGHTLVMPIRQLTAATRRIAGGDLKQRAPVKGSEEFCQLAESFNRMADRLAEEQALLERRVDERTRELAKSKAGYEELADRIPVGVYVFRIRADGSMAFEYVSPPFCRLLGLAAADVLADASLAFAPTHPDDLASFVALNQEVARTLQPFLWEGRFVIGGETRWLRIQSTPTPQANGDSLWNGVIVDITERKLAEQEIRRASAYNRSLIEASLDPLVTIGPDGKITDVNAATEAVTGLARNNLIGTEFSDYFSDPEKARAGYRQVFREGNVSDYALDIRHRDGHLTPVLYNAAIFRDDNGKVTGVFAAARNITERKRAEDTVRRLNAELEQRVEQRTAQLEAANKELEEFSYAMSHDMRAPLRAIDGYSKILLDDHGAGLDDEGRRLQTAVRGNAQRMGQLIDDILHFLNMRKRKIAAGVVDIADLAREAFAELQASLPADRAARLVVGSLPQAWGDREMIRQVVWNLLSNALKFSSPDREAVIEIGGAAEAHVTSYHVRDNGVGFDMRYADKLFKVFERVHPTGQYKGTAIGLAIVKRIVERHGGRVWAEGRVGEGATFHFALPNRGE